MKYIAVLVASALTAVTSSTEVRSPQSPARLLTHADMAQLWQEPVDLLQRDLYAGPGGVALTPREDRPYAFVAHKTTGVNPGYDVRAAAGRLWSVKLGGEAQAEVSPMRVSKRPRDSAPRATASRPWASGHGTRTRSSRRGPSED